MSRKLLQYQQNQLCFGLNPKPLIDFIKNYDRPVIVYDLDIIKERISWIQRWSDLGKLHFAVKANFHPRILKTIKQAGCGADVVSVGEIKRALECGFEMKDIIFSGVGKSLEELTWAIERDIYQINVESISELKKIIRICTELNKKVNLGLRINPEVDAETHKSISTALKDSKFGLDFETGRECIQMIANNHLLDLKSLSFHLGSQILNVSVYEKAIRVMRPYFEEARKFCPELGRMDLGGGIGIDYHDADSEQDELRWTSLQNLYAKELNGFKAIFLLEIGRFLTARSGVLISRIEIIKKTPSKNFLILDTGMTHIMRPALYGAYHQILPLLNKSGVKEIYDVVGPICESTDVLGTEREMTSVDEEDFVAICDVGAYGSVMASDYNLRDRVKEIFIQDLI
jgi:diaminopimelate decarboxylase